MNKVAAIPSAPYTRHEVIGRGSYGVVYKGLHNVTKQAVAIKVLNLDTAEDEVSDIQKEIVLLQALKAGDAQNVVRYHGSFLHGTRLWIIMDYCEGGSIRTLMKSGKIEERYIAIIVREVLAALSYIHKADIIHRDLKAANILVTNDGRVQLCDFGVAAQLAANHFKRNTFVGTPYWMAPEVISDGMSYNFKADIWSLGITIYEIATGNPPYADQEPMRAIFLIPRNAAPKLDGSLFSPQMKELVTACLSERPEDRPAAADLLKTRWMKSTSKSTTQMLRELIARYESWRKNGGIRKSLAMGGDIDVDEDFDGHFGLEDDHEVEANAWDFGTVRQASSQETKQPTWEQSADATEDLLRTIRPITNQQGSSASNGTTSRSEHPLMKLFGDGRPGQAQHPAVQSMAELSRSRDNAIVAPPTPSHEAITIEMPALGAVSLASASSISLPAMSSTIGSAAPSPRILDMPTKFGLKDVRGIGLVPSRQNSFDIFGHNPQRNHSGNSVTLASLPNHSDDHADQSLDQTERNTSETINGSPTSPQKSSKSVSPIRSRPSSPTRLPPSNQFSPPSSPSKSAARQQMHSTSTSISSTSSVMPKSNFAAGLGLSHMHLSGSAQSLPDILPRPSISGASRDRSPSTGSVPMLPKQHMKKPSNLVLQMPALGGALEDGYLPPSPSRALNGVPFTTVPQSYTPTPLNQEIVSQSHASTEKSRMVSNRLVYELPPLTPLSLDVLNDQDHNAVVSELTRVVGDMLTQLTHVENGLSGMTFNQ